MTSNGNSDRQSVSPAMGAPEAGAATPASSPGKAEGQDAAPPTAPPSWLGRRWAWMYANFATLVLVALVLGAGGFTWWWARNSYFEQFGGIEPLGASATDARAAWGQFGDYMGGVVNPLLSLLTLLALVATVALQRQQLQISRAELKATRKELKKSARAQRMAAEAMKGQLEQARLTAEAQRAAALSALLPRLIEREASSKEHLDNAASPSVKDAYLLIARNHAEMAGRRVKVDQELLRVTDALLPSTKAQLSVSEEGRPQEFR